MAMVLRRAAATFCCDHTAKNLGLLAMKSAIFVDSTLVYNKKTPAA
jgi:hypothetical protein